MSEKKKRDQKKETTELTDETLEQASGGNSTSGEVRTSQSGDADDRPTEEVAFYYNKIAFGYAKTTDGKEWDS